MATETPWWFQEWGALADERLWCVEPQPGGGIRVRGYNDAKTDYDEVRLTRFGQNVRVALPPAGHPWDIIAGLEPFRPFFEARRIMLERGLEQLAPYMIHSENAAAIWAVAFPGKPPRAGSMQLFGSSFAWHSDLDHLLFKL